jgi:hypothetical protein
MKRNRLKFILAVVAVLALFREEPLLHEKGNGETQNWKGFWRSV